MPQIQVLPGVPTFGSELQKILTQTGTQIGKGLIERTKREELTGYQSVLQKQRELDYSRKLESQIGTYLNKVLELSGLEPQKKATIYADAVRNVNQGQDIGAAIQSALSTTLDKKPEQEPSFWDRIFERSAEIPTQPEQAPIGTLEQAAPDAPAKPADKDAYTSGQTFDKLPTTAPEGAIMRKGSQRFVFKKGKWSGM
jgi:hypothetical protein